MESLQNQDRPYAGVMVMISHRLAGPEMIRYQRRHRHSSRVSACVCGGAKSCDQDVTHRGFLAQSCALCGPETVDFLCSNQLPRASGRDETWAFGTPGVGFGPVGSVSVSHPLLDQALRPGEYGWGGMAGTAWTNDPQEDFVLLSFSLVAFDLSTEEVLRAGVRKAISEFQKEAAQRRLCWLRRCRRYQSLIRTRRYGAECVKRRLCSRHEGFRAPHS